MTRGFKIIALALGLTACGQTAPLKPLPGRSLPVRPLMARSTPTVTDLLALPPQAVPRRVDELLTKNQPRRADRFDLPPADGGAPPVEGETTTQAPATTGPDNVEEPR
jgi:predicted small lipoprotein YifL